MPIGEYQLERCLDVIDKIKQRKISEMFFRPLDQVIDNLPSDFSQKMTKVIDLSIIRQNLVNGIYSSIGEWKRDINILWQNFFNIFKHDDPQYLMAKELEESFNKLSELITDNPAQDWEAKLSMLKDNFLSLSKKGPKSIFGDEGVELTPNTSSTQSVATSKKKSSTSSRNKKRSPQNLESQTIPVVSSSNIQEIPENTLTPINETDVDVTKLKDDIEKVATDENMPMMLNIIKENESSFQNDENDEVEVELSQLSAKTLKLLRNYINTLLENSKENPSN